MNWLSLLVVVLTLLIIVIRPFSLGEAWPAACGALAMSLIGAITPDDLLAVGGETDDLRAF